MKISWLQTHVISWTGFAMRLFHIYFGYLGIMAYHIQRSMTQKRLEGKNISSRAQIGDGEGMPEFMRISFLDFCPVSQPIDQDTQTVLVESSICMADEEGGVGIVPIFSAGKITPNRFSCNLTQVHSASFTAFRATCHSVTDGDLSGLEIHIVDDQRTQLSCSQSSVQQHQHNRLVTVGTRPAHYKLLPFLSLRFAGIDTRLEDFFNVFFGKCFNRMFLKLRGCDFFSGIGNLNSTCSHPKKDRNVTHTFRMDLADSGSELPFQRLGLYSVLNQAM